jgi:hypothetical protein
VKASFNQNVLFDYSIKMPGFMPILVLCADVFRGHVVDIDFQPCGQKSDCKEGGFWGKS